MPTSNMVLKKIQKKRITLRIIPVSATIVALNRFGVITITPHDISARIQLSRVIRKTCFTIISTLLKNR